MTGGQLSSSGASAWTLANALSLNGTMTLGDATNTGALTFSGTTSIAGTTALTIPSAVTLSGLVVGAFNFTKAGANTLTLGAANTVSGTTQVTAGTLTLSNVNGLQNSTVDWGTSTVGTLSLPASAVLGGLSTASGTLNTFTQNGAYSVGNNNASATFGGVLAGTGAITKIGTGSWTLTGNNTNSGAISVSAGTLNANSATAMGAASSMAGISVTSGATLSLGAAPTYSTRSLTVSGTGSASAPNNGALVIANAETNTFGGITIGATGTYIRATNSGSINAPFTSNNNSIVFGASAGSDFIPFASLLNVFSGTGSVTYGGHSLDTGIVRADVRHTYTGNTTLAYGTTYVNSSLELPATGGPFGNKSLTAANTLLMTGGTLSYLGGSTDYSGRFSTAGGQQWKIDVAGQTVAFATALVGASSLSLNDTSTGGSLTLSSSASTFSGGVTITSGTLYAGAAQSGSSGPLGITGTITFAPAGTGVLAYTSASASFDYSSRFATSSGQSRRINANGESVTFSTAMGGDNALLLVGSAGTLTLAVANTYTQGTTISVGTLKAGNATALGTGAVTLSARGATLQTLTTGGQNGKLTVASLNNAAGGTIKIGG